MWSLIVEGGFWMWFLLFFGACALGAAVRFALVPSRRSLRVVLALSVTTLFSALTAIAGDISAVGHQAPRYLAAHPETSLSEVVLLGVGESMSPAIVGCSLLTLVAFVVAFGLFRQDA